MPIFYRLTLFIRCKLHRKLSQNWDIIHYYLIISPSIYGRNQRSSVLAKELLEAVDAELRKCKLG